MSIFRYTFPIKNYEGTDTFEKHVDFEGERCPTKEQVIKCLKDAANEYTNEKIGEWWEGFECEEMECVKAIENICFTDGKLNDDWPKVAAGGIIMVNVHCKTEFGIKPLTCELIRPYKI